MNPEQLQALLDYIDARIEEQIVYATTHDALTESLRTRQLRELLEAAFARQVSSLDRTPDA